MKLMGKEVGHEFPPFMIAELSQNYANLDEAGKLMKACKEAGADAIKVQAIAPDEITLNCDTPDFHIAKGLWEGKKLYDLYKWNGADFPNLLDIGAALGIPVFTSVFGLGTLHAVAEMGCPAFKISSFENRWDDLIYAARNSGRPVLISLGMMSTSDIDTFIHKHYTRRVIPMHCVSAYPTRLADADLWKIGYLRESVSGPVGFSDHTIGTKAAEYAVALGARVIEKHVSLRYDTMDGAFSAIPKTFRTLVDNCHLAWKASGTRENVYTEAESEPYQRSIYVAEDIEAGGYFTAINLRVVRPHYGIDPNRFGEIVGKTAKKALKRGSALTEEDVIW